MLRYLAALVAIESLYTYTLAFTLIPLGYREQTISYKKNFSHIDVHVASLNWGKVKLKFALLCIPQHQKFFRQFNYFLSLLSFLLSSFQKLCRVKVFLFFVFQTMMQFISENNEFWFLENKLNLFYQAKIVICLVEWPIWQINWNFFSFF